MSSYTYNTISDSDGSLQEKFLEYSKTWEESNYKEKKRVKIITNNNDDKNVDNTVYFEKLINSFIISNQNRIKIYDIKFTEKTVMIIYESLNSKN